MSTSTLKTAVLPHGDTGKLPPPSAAEMVRITTEVIIPDHETRTKNPRYSDDYAACIRTLGLVIKHFLAEMGMTGLESAMFSIGNFAANESEGEVISVNTSFYDNGNQGHSDCPGAGLYMCFAPNRKEIQLRDYHGKPVGKGLFGPEMVAGFLRLRYRDGVSLHHSVKAHDMVCSKCETCRHKK